MNIITTHDCYNHEKTFDEVCAEWLRFKQSKLKESSYARYLTIIQKHVLPAFGTVHTSEYSCHLFEDGLLRIMGEGGSRLSKSTMHSIVYIVKSVIKYGSRHYYNRELKIEFECSDLNQKDSVQVLSNEDEYKLVMYLQSSPMNSNHLGILISLMTGMRIGEVCALSRKNIDKRDRVISICETAQRINRNGHTSLHVTPPKSKQSIRQIPIPDMVYACMTRNGVWGLQEEHRILSRSTIPYEPRTLQYAYKKILKKCNIEYVNFHCLRHTFATNCVELGFDVKTLSELLGHSSVNFTLNRYVHSSISLKRKEMNLIDNKYAEFQRINNYTKFYQP